MSNTSKSTSSPGESKPTTKRSTSKRSTKSATKSSTSKSRGRPTGSKTKERPIATVEPSRCERCGSTDREKYHGTRTLKHVGEHDGKPYNVIRWKRTRCTACGQHRVDKFHEQTSDGEQ